MQHIHLIAFNTPEPPNYGGIIDIFYGVKALYAVGFRITLHCFYQDDRKARELHYWCEVIYYYPRKTAIQSISLKYPIMMKSRRNKTLLENLVNDDSPIFFEGIQTCYHLNHPALRNRLKLVKIHNIEWKYYQALGQATPHPFLKFYYFWESRLLSRVEPILQHADYLLTVNRQETENYQSRFSGVRRLPCFHGNRTVTSRPGNGHYFLYHGNLAIAENQKAVAFLLKQIMPNLDYRLIIAGKDPNRQIIKQIDKSTNVELMKNPDDTTLKSIIQEAHIHLLPSFQNTGFKIKLINTLFLGRHCLVTPEMVEGSGLERLCHIANNPKDFIRKTEQLMETPFTENHIQQRRNYLHAYFNDIANAHYIKRLIDGHAGTSSNIEFEASQGSEFTDS